MWRRRRRRTRVKLAKLQFAFKKPYCTFTLSMSHSFFHRTVFIQPCHCIHSFLCSVGKWRNWGSVVENTLVARNDVLFKMDSWRNWETWCRNSPCWEKQWAIGKAKQALQSKTQVWVGRCGCHCSRIPGNQQSVGRRPLSFVECLLISHFLIAVAFLFVIIQSTARFNEQIRSCTRRLAYLPAAIPDFDFLINTDLRALRGRRPKSFFQLFQTLDSQLDCRLS